jgi:hypothetical protein
MTSIENHTACYLREILATRAHADPEMTAFLATWTYEEYWHGEALGWVLEAHGMEGASRRATKIRSGRLLKDEIRLIGFNLTSFAGLDLVAVQTTWGALNELTTQMGYRRLSAIEGHPVLSELLKRIMRQEGRHFDVYRQLSTARLQDHPLKQRILRTILQRFWEPVGSGVMPNEEVAFLGKYLFQSEQGKESARHVDEQFARIPGMENLHLFESRLQMLGTW